MISKFDLFFWIFVFSFSFVDSFHEKFRVPHLRSEKLESYVYNDKEYFLENFPVDWENAKILCRGRFNASLAVLDTKQKAEFFAEALSESQLSVEAVWVGARRVKAEDPMGYRWGNGIELRRTALDVIGTNEKDVDKHYPWWLNRTRIPVPVGGADCVALERAFHDRPVFVDLPCHLERPFVCEKDASKDVAVSELKTIRCRTGLYRLFDGSLDWHEAAAYCVMNKMTLANIGTMRCLKKLGMLMLKTRPSMENAWVGARGEAGHWWWVDTGVSIFRESPYSDSPPGTWPPMRNDTAVKPSGCLQLDRHATHSPVFMEARCERKMQFICYEPAPQLVTARPPPSDETYYYILVRKLLPWTQAYENCLKMKGNLGTLDNNDILIQLLLVMGENNAPVDNIWVAGQLNASKDATTDAVVYNWNNPVSKKKIPDLKTVDASSAFVPPWLDEEPSLDSPCLNLDRQEHVKGLVYGLPCDTPQYSVCMIEKAQMITEVAEATTSGFGTVPSKLPSAETTHAVYSSSHKTEKDLAVAVQSFSSSPTTSNFKPGVSGR